jgi:inhibitor of KinA sporulation pathway (predicted exonuclease)
MKDQLRAWLDKIIKNLDLLDTFENRKNIKKQVGKVRKHITDDRKNPSTEEIFAWIWAQPDNLDILFHNMTSPFVGDMDKKEMFKRIWDNLTYIDRYEGPKLPIHPDYKNIPTVDNIKTYVDQYGMNVFETKIHRKIADAALLAYEKKHLKPLYKPEVRKSDPVEGYRHGD